MLSSRKLFLPWATPLLLVGLAGCGGGGLVPVTGTLKYKGKAVPNAYVDFMPENGRPSWGLTDEQGRFKLEFDRKHDGAMVGKHKVSVRMKPSTTVPLEPGMERTNQATSPEMREFFDKYSAQKSTKQVTIDKSTREVDLNLD